MYRAAAIKNSVVVRGGATKSLLLHSAKNNLFRATAALLPSIVRHRYNSSAATEAEVNDESSSSSYPPYQKPLNLQQWETLANKELSRSNKTIDTLRTQRLTPEGISFQPVYYNLDTSSPDLPGIAPYDRGPYATMYTNRPWTIRQYAVSLSKY